MTSAPKAEILGFIETEIATLGILQSVYQDSSKFSHDGNLVPVLQMISQQIVDRKPFWELRCLLRWAAHRLKPEKYLEVGNRTGWSLLQVVAECPAVSVFGFDVWIDDYANAPNASPDQLRNLMKEAGHMGPAYFASGNSQLTLPAFIGGLRASDNPTQTGFDLITVDGDHSREGACRDLELCAGLVKPGGVIVFDDLIHREHGYLLELWRRFQNDHREFVCLENVRDYPGTGVGFRLPLPGFFPTVSRASDESLLVGSEERVSQAYVLHAESVAYENARRAQKELEAKEAVIARTSGDLQQVRADQSAKQEVITHQQAILAARESAIAQLADELAEHRSLAWGLAHLAVWSKRMLRSQTANSFRRERKINSNSVSHHSLHVGLDVMEIKFGASGGVEVYMKTLVRALTAEAIRVTLLCTPDQLRHLRSLFDDQVAYYSFNPELAVSLFLSAQRLLLRNEKTAVAKHTNVSFARLRERLGIDVLHSPVQIFSRTDFLMPSVLNLHDLQHLHHPENFTEGDLRARSRLYAHSVALASAVIASSDFVRHDIIERMGMPAAKVFTVPVACDPDVESGLREFTAEQARQKYHLPQTFGFYPANFWLHKNHARLIEALAITRNRAPLYDFKLVLTGYRKLSGWPHVEQALDKFNMRNHVLVLDYIPTKHLAAIYREAAFCIVPSLFEASSYPVIEAQTLGCPAMCSNVTSLPELMIEGAGLLFDPLSVEDMAEGMLRWLKDPADRLAYAERGQRRARLRHSLPAYATRIRQIYDLVHRGWNADNSDSLPGF